METLETTEPKLFEAAADLNKKMVLSGVGEIEGLLEDLSGERESDLEVWVAEIYGKITMIYGAQEMSVCKKAYRVFIGCLQKMIEERGWGDVKPVVESPDSIGMKLPEGVPGSVTPTLVTETPAEPVIEVVVTQPTGGVLVEVETPVEPEVKPEEPVTAPVETPVEPEVKPEEPVAAPVKKTTRKKK